MLISAVAHVLHGVYEPWGVGTQTYYVQHLSLFVTTFVFTMGLLFKVQGVSQASGVYAGLAALMLLLCLSFGVVWLGCMVTGVVKSLQRRRMAKRLVRRPLARSSSDGGSDAGDDADAADAAIKPRGASLSAASAAMGGTPMQFTENPVLRARRLLGPGASSRLLATTPPTHAPPPPPPPRPGALAAAAGSAVLASGSDASSGGGLQVGNPLLSSAARRLLGASVRPGAKVSQPTRPEAVTAAGGDPVQVGASATAMPLLRASASVDHDRATSTAFVSSAASPARLGLKATRGSVDATAIAAPADAGASARPAPPLLRAERAQSMRAERA